MKYPILAAAALTAGLLASAPAAAQSSAPTPPCRDPWVSQAIKEVKGRTALGLGEGGECNIQLYGGRWGSYGELKGYVQQAFAALAKAGLEFQYAQGTVLRDITYFAGYASAGQYIGPRGSAPRKEWMIDLPGGNVLAIDRRCRPGYAAAGPGANSGCVRGGVN